MPEIRSRDELNEAIAQFEFTVLDPRGVLELRCNRCGFTEMLGGYKPTPLQRLTDPALDHDCERR